MIKRLEAVIVCVNYADFLAQTLPYNMRQFDHMVVVTDSRDRETADLCAHLGVECRSTDLFFHQGDKFAKSRAIDYGLAYLRGDDWVVHLDADIWLPPMARQLLEKTRLDADCIYGIDRVNCCGYDAWNRFVTSEPRNSAHHQHIRNCLTIPPPFPMGARIVIPHYEGFLPIGFFQLWNAARHPTRRYPLNHGSAERTDVLHSLQWPANHRRLLPDFIGVHLESKAGGKMGDNWSGRTTPRFGPNGGDQGNPKHYVR